MPVTVEETNRSRKADPKRGQREYIIKGCTDEGSALVALISNAATAVNAMLISLSECSVEEVANDIYLGTAVYISTGVAALQRPGSFSVSFDISGQAMHINCALANQGQFPAQGQPKRDFKGAINVDQDGTVNGVDIFIPTTTVTLNYTTDPANVTEAYVATVSRLVGGVNNGPFKGFAAGELLLSRVAGQQRDGEAWDLSFGFAVSENKTNLTIGGITGITSRGWDYLWVYYVKKEDKPNNVMLKVPAQANVEQVYPYKDFGLLGLP